MLTSIVIQKDSYGKTVRLEERENGSFRSVKHL